MSRGHLAAAVVAATFALAMPAAASADSFPLMGWWPLNEGSGQTVRDWSGHGNDGYLGNVNVPDSHDPTWIKGVLLGSALAFGGDDFVTIPDAASLEPANLTVAAWIRGDSSPGINQYVLSKGAFQCNYPSYGLYSGLSGGISFLIGGASQFYRSAEAPASVWDGKWHHVAGTYDGKNLRLYVDGVQVGQPTAAPGGINYNIQGGGFIGTYDACNGALSLHGDVDGIQIWSQALPVDTIWRTLKALFSLAK
jgi:hypothetical protein